MTDERTYKKAKNIPLLIFQAIVIIAIGIGLSILNSEQEKKQNSEISFDEYKNISEIKGEFAEVDFKIYEFMNDGVLSRKEFKIITNLVTESKKPTPTDLLNIKKSISSNPASN